MILPQPIFHPNFLLVYLIDWLKSVENYLVLARMSAALSNRQHCLKYLLGNIAIYVNQWPFCHDSVAYAVGKTKTIRMNIRCYLFEWPRHSQWHICRVNVRSQAYSRRSALFIGFNKLLILKSLRSASGWSEQIKIQNPIWKRWQNELAKRHLRLAPGCWFVYCLSCRPNVLPWKSCNKNEINLNDRSVSQTAHSPMHLTSVCSTRRSSKKCWVFN